MGSPGRTRRLRPLSTLFDSGALITAAKFSARGQWVIDHLLTCCRIAVLPEVKHETVDAGLLRGYPDAVELERRVSAGSVRIVPAAVPDPELEPVLAHLGLQDTDRALVHACRAMPARTRVITDDHRLWVTATRLRLPAAFLPDVVLLLAHRGRIPCDLAKEILHAVHPRYAAGFVELVLKRLEGLF